MPEQKSNSADPVAWLAKELTLDFFKATNHSLVGDANDFSPDELFSAAHAEGVASLIAARLAKADPSVVSPAMLSAFAAAAHQELLFSMRFEAEERSILRVLAECGVEGLLLKGNALAHWAYATPHLRSRSDVDVLLESRAAVELVARRLAESGYSCIPPSAEAAAYEMMCRREITSDWSIEIDLHWRLSNSPLFAECFSFAELMAGSIPLRDMPANARGLSPIHACLHACVHRALNLSIGDADRLKWLYDILLLASQFSSREWQMLGHLSIDRRIAGVVLSALEATKLVLRLEIPKELVEALRQAQSLEALDATRLGDWRYMQRRTYASLPGLKSKLLWGWGRLFPSKAYLRYLYNSQSSYALLLCIRIQRLANRLMR